MALLATGDATMRIDQYKFKLDYDRRLRKNPSFTTKAYVTSDNPALSATNSMRATVDRID